MSQPAVAVLGGSALFGKRSDAVVIGRFADRLGVILSRRLAGAA
jgi:hypothetical protein